MLKCKRNAVVITALVLLSSIVPATGYSNAEGEEAASDHGEEKMHREIRYFKF